MQKATRQHTKEHNRNLVLKTIIEHHSISRAEIKAKFGNPTIIFLPIRRASRITESTFFTSCMLWLSTI